MNSLKRVALAWSLLAPVVGLAQYDKAPLVPAGKTIKVTENIYVIPDQRLELVPNIGIIVGQRGILVIDTGMGPRNASTVLNEVRKVSPKKILFLTITHFHPEHGMGAQSFAGATIVYPRAQKEELIEKRQEFIKMFNGFSPAIADLLKPVKLVMPDVVFSDAAELDLGDVTVQLLHWGPAHTRGDEFVFLPKQKILFAGDVVPNRFFPIMPDKDSSGTNWIRMLERMEQLHPVTVVPGHGAVGDASLIVRVREYLVYVRDRVQQLKSRGTSLADAEKTLGPEVRAKYKDWDDPDWIKNAIDNFYSSSR